MPRLIHGIVAYTFLNVCEKIHQFLSSIKIDAHKRKWFLSSTSRCVCEFVVAPSLHRIVFLHTLIDEVGRNIDLQ